VALGDEYERTKAKNIKKLPGGKHSCKGVGKTTVGKYESLPSDEVVKCPIGDLKDSGIGESELLYNEYIVYDVGQVKMKYLVKLKFNPVEDKDDLW